MNENKFTPRAEEALRLAQEAAGELGHGYVGTEHLLLGLIREEEGLAHTVLTDAGLTDDMMVEIIKKSIGVGLPGSNPAQGLTPRAKRVIEIAMEDSVRGGYPYIGTEHLLAGVLREGNNMAVRILRTAGADARHLYTSLMQKLNDTPRGKAAESRATAATSAREDSGKNKTLREYTRDLTADARAGKLDPVIGRDNEIQRVVQILSRRTKNNPCLIGEPGVGKTAIAEGLARKIAMGDVPEDLLDKRLLSLDLSGMVAGTKYRGEFEERIKKVLSEVKKDGNIILFIDEVHTIVGAGSAEGAVDAANIIKPALGRGEIRCLGATTLNEYRKYIEKDAALERRFQPVQVQEPAPEAALEILRGGREKYELHHKLQITDEALEAAVSLSTRYINDRFLPDKAIDLMDEAASRVRMEEEELSPEIKSLEEKIAALAKDKDAAITKQDFETAAQLRDIEKNYQDQLDMEREHRRKNRCQHRPVLEEDIASVVAEWTGIPVTRLTEDESQRLLRMEELLHERVVGQEEAVTAVAKAIRRSRVGLKDPKRPIGSFLFLGPTGVGKTELCKSLAEAMFGDENAMIRIDMSEYMERHTVSRLIGSPPGYVGHEEGGQLTEKVRRKPYAVILFDEIEKAHEDVWNVLLQILDDGRITDSQGRTVDFKNTVIVMTSNIGAKSLTAASAKLGFSTEKTDDDDTEKAFERAKELVVTELRQTFRPEFLNRIDETIVFRALTEADIQEVARRMLKTVSSRMESMGIHLDASNDAVAELAREGFDPKYGARPLRRAIQNKVEDAVAEKLLDGTLTNGDTAQLMVEGNELVVTRQAA
ncbi:MAG: ATP-dependent Clp protease ATP-binding subunit [Oscillibacter sp.]|nr:ATP-dependent Clp protease ATP-binding subunit [Oscillibacter sp.]